MCSFVVFVYLKLFLLCRLILNKQKPFNEKVFPNCWYCTFKDWDMALVSEESVKKIFKSGGLVWHIKRNRLHINIIPTHINNNSYLDIIQLKWCNYCYNPHQVDLFSIKPFEGPKRTRRAIPKYHEDPIP